MASRSKIEEFLAQQGSEGDSEGSGAFSISPEKALQKIATYQQAFPEVWLVKIIQAAVRAGSSGIDVKLTAEEARFCFEGESWSPELLEEAFHKPESTGDPALDHLLLGLWYVALGKDHPFTLVFPNQGALHWDGDRFQRRDGSVYRLTLVVPHLRVGQIVSWIQKRRVIAQRCLELASCLRERCFPCAVPLTLDGQRLDFLFQNFGPDSKARSLPVTHGLIRSDLPRWSLPPGGYQREGGGQAKEEASVAWTISLHFSAQQGYWRGEHWESELLWVSDGAVLFRERLPNTTRCVSLSIVASAEGLETDVSGFRLVRDEKLTQRRDKVLKSVSVRVSKAGPDFERAIADLGSSAATSGKAGAVMGGIALLFLVPALGVAALGIILGRNTDTEARKFLLQDAKRDWKSLRWEISRGY